MAPGESGQQQAAVAELVPEVVLGPLVGLTDQRLPGHGLQQEQVAGAGGVPAGQQAGHHPRRSVRRQHEVGPTFASAKRPVTPGHRFKGPGDRGADGEDAATFPSYVLHESGCRGGHPEALR